jgi:hypothetical protein
MKSVNNPMHSPCGAHCRTTGEPCKNHKVTGSTRCRMHGGTSQGRPPTHGQYTKKAKAQRAEMRDLIRGINDLMAG